MLDSVLRQIKYMTTIFLNRAVKIFDKNMLKETKTSERKEQAEI
jgi:hypothetical protein